jgi:23S rRNA-/tRNA-specific pseudouridylate synthase
VRVHCALLGCPVLGDPIYGGALIHDHGERLHLLARAIELPLNPPVAATAEPPRHMRAALVRCG